MTNKTEAKKRRPYQKPQLEQILLKAEEAVLGICKTSGGSGPSYPGCSLSSEGGQCSLPGS